ncbi:hypothetical protein MGWOODY_Tha1836 [hydrothermal vent metagenome]|uniref:Uncharacterized protein n=1 Tax=hydrothermal vent metagenome TaxID=652676 RepID=A0A160TET5_9ZZZZ
MIVSCDHVLGADIQERDELHAGILLQKRPGIVINAMSRGEGRCG